jgi:hypothetical protein
MALMQLVDRAAAPAATDEAADGKSTKKKAKAKSAAKPRARKAAAAGFRDNASRGTFVSLRCCGEPGKPDIH